MLRFRTGASIPPSPPPLAAGCSADEAAAAMEVESTGAQAVGAGEDAAGEARRGDGAGASGGGATGAGGDGAGGGSGAAAAGRGAAGGGATGDGAPPSRRTGRVLVGSALHICFAGAWSWIVYSVPRTVTSAVRSPAMKAASSASCTGGSYGLKEPPSLTCHTPGGGKGAGAGGAAAAGAGAGRGAESLASRSRRDG